MKLCRICTFHLIPFHSLFPLQTHIDYSSFDAYPGGITSPSSLGLTSSPLLHHRCITLLPPPSTQPHFRLLFTSISFFPTTAHLVKSTPTSKSSLQSYPRHRLLPHPRILPHAYIHSSPTPPPIHPVHLYL